MSVFSKIGNLYGSVLGSVLNLGGKSLNKVTGVTAQQDKAFQQQLQANNLTYQQQKEMMEAQNQFDVNMWNLQNQYNSPAAQLARMREAGVDMNPTSYALGTGNLTSTASSVGSNSGFSGSGFSGSGSPAGNPISMLMGVVQGIQGVRESKARTDNIKEQTNNTVSMSEFNSEHARQMRNDNDFFEKHGYYPTHADTPVGSGYETGLGADILGALSRGYQKYQERIK